MECQLVYKCYEFFVNFSCWICSWTCQPDWLEEHQHPGNNHLQYIKWQRGFKVSSWTPFRHCSSGCSALCFGGLKLHPQYSVGCYKIYTLLSKECKYPPPPTKFNNNRSSPLKKTFLASPVVIIIPPQMIPQQLSEFNFSWNPTHINNKSNYPNQNFSWKQVYIYTNRLKITKFCLSLPLCLAWKYKHE